MPSPPYEGTSPRSCRWPLTYPNPNPNPNLSPNPNLNPHLIKWGCYSDQRLKWEPSYKTWPCGRTAFARSQSPGEPANLSKTYEGPYELALGWFFAMPRGLAAVLAQSPTHHSNPTLSRNPTPTRTLTLNPSGGARRTLTLALTLP